MVALSANAMPADIQRALEAGFDDYWTKPLDFQVFNAALDQVFGAAPRGAPTRRGSRRMTPLRQLTLDVSDNDEGVVTIEAARVHAAAQHAAALAEAQQVLEWAWRAFPHTHGPTDDGGEWDHDLQSGVEAGGWHAVALTLTGTPEFARAFAAEFSSDED